MRRIEFIAPVDSMRGNLSGEQKLLYAKNNNPAFDAPAGVQYARNYRPSYIGAKRKSDSLKYFNAKTKSATKIDATSLQRMALLGATGALVGSIMRQKEGTPYIRFRLVWTTAQLSDPSIMNSFRKWLFDVIYSGLQSKSSQLSASAIQPSTGTQIGYSIPNPFVATGAQATGAEISAIILAKFWLQLATNPVKYKVQGSPLPLIGHTGETFANLINSGHNIISLELDNDEHTGFVKNNVSAWLNINDAAGIVGHNFTAAGTDVVNLQEGNSYYFSPEWLDPSA